MQRVVFTVFVILAICGGVGADQGRTEIGPTDTFPIVIDTPGSYVLTADLHMVTAGTAAIEITADNVTLDLGGHVVRGPGSGANGNVTVRDSFLGISLFKASATNCTAIGNINDGIFLRYSSLIGGTSNDNGGSGVRADFGSAVIGVAVSDNGYYGIDLASGGNCNAVNCTGGNNSPANVSGCGDGNACHQNYLP
jgi:hypothetical protein